MKELYLYFNADLQIQNLKYALQILDYEDQQAFIENKKIPVLDHILDMSIRRAKKTNINYIYKPLT